MSASKVAWISAFAGILVALGIAVSASGMMPVLTPHSGPSPPSTNGAGNNSTGPPTLYSLTFSETGLPNGTFWWVSLHGSYWGWFPPVGSATPFRGFGWNGSTTPSVGFVVPNGTYPFAVKSAWANGTLYTPNPAIGTVTVNGSNVSDAIQFSPASYYTVSFTETGLPNGTFWSVVVGGANGGGHWTPAARTTAAAGRAAFGWNGTNGSSISFELANGTYSYFVPGVWTTNGSYLASPRSGTITVNGSAVNVSISFSVPAAYAITFTESGLPNGTNWSVLLTGGTPWGFGFNTSATSSLGFARTDGTYRFAVPDVWAPSGLYQANPGCGNVTVNGTGVSVAVTFSLIPFYNVTFVESGLPNGTLWSAALFGAGPGHATWGSSNTSTLTLSRPNGTYRFGIGPAWNSTGFFTANPTFGNVSVNGTSVTIDITFTFSNYTSGWQPTAAGPTALGTSAFASTAAHRPS